MRLPLIVLYCALAYSGFDAWRHSPYGSDAVLSALNTSLTGTLAAWNPRDDHHVYRWRGVDGQWRYAYRPPHSTEIPAADPAPSAQFWRDVLAGATTLPQLSALVDQHTARIDAAVGAAL